MVDEKPHQIADRPRGLLNPRYRRYLLGESDIKKASQAERDVRAGIRRNLYHGLLDFVLIYQCVEQRDIDQSLIDLEDDEQLSRDEAIANAMALFLDLGSGDELADAAEFERYVEQAAKLAWHARHDTSEAENVWLGEPHADLSVQFPDRIDLDALVKKVDSVWKRLETLDPNDIGGPWQERGEIGTRLGLDALNSDEILYLTSILEVAPSDRDGPDLTTIKAVVQAWFVWQQQVRHNLPDNDSHVLQFLQEAIRYHQEGG